MKTLLSGLVDIRANGWFVKGYTVEVNYLAHLLPDGGAHAVRNLGMICA
jgi:hypothetical protein